MRSSPSTGTCPDRVGAHSWPCRGSDGRSPGSGGGGGAVLMCHSWGRTGRNLDPPAPSQGTVTKSISSSTLASSVGSRSL
ncbi:hypothetical protein [Ornithinimicrobium kibberense]|uniref:hypothetical protein n=1 Tax=Ornithinimicrobium kibberense TaxID=282060 RepID=UPI00361ADAF2